MCVGLDKRRRWEWDCQLHGSKLADVSAENCFDVGRCGPSRVAPFPRPRIEKKLPVYETQTGSMSALNYLSS